jgi:diguanylate cyclase (GGDEF)-like protein
MLSGDGPLVRAAKWLAAVTALVVAFGTPAGYLYFGYLQEGVAATAEIEIQARQISRLISGNPDYWQFEEIRISEFLQHSDSGHSKDFHRVLARSGKVVAQYPDPAPIFDWPVLRRQQPLFDYGEPVGRIEVTHSLEGLYSNTALIAIFSVLAGLLILWGLRVLPLRALKRAWDRVAYLASHDALTGLPNRTLFLDRLEHVLVNAPRRDQAVTVHSLDLDHFKDVNDTLGHAAGDAVLRQVADRMQAALRQGDTLARFGGDEFAIIQSDTEKPETAATLAERIIAEVSKPYNIDGQEALLGASIGMATYTPDNPVDAKQLLKNADLALYNSKSDGRGTYHFFHEEMDTELRDRKKLEMDLRRALREEQFELHYQPQVDLTSQRIIGLEALIRWRHPERGNVSPPEFLPVAESSGLIRPISEWVLFTACREAVKWAPLRIAVNLSPSQFQQRDFVAIVERALAQSGLPANRLELEITEVVLITDTTRTLGVLNALRQLGIHIAMDDFGTGYSSLGYLRRFPFDKIKIDRSFISDLDNDGDAQAIVRAIIGLSRALSIHINAEGVETLEQAQALLKEGCEEVQGYLYGKPMPPKDINELLIRSGVLSAPADAAGSPVPIAKSA